MNEPIIFEDVTIYKDINLEKPFRGFLTGKYTVQVVDKKARVSTDSPFVAKEDSVSRLNKLNKLASWIGGDSPDMYKYGMIVNGMKCYFKIEHNIYADKK